MPQPSLRPDWYEKGKKDGRYVLGPLLGHGGMGDVVEAWDTILGRLVALKILNHAEPAAMVRFMHEAQLQAKLEHPNICRIYDIEAHEGVPRIAMQLVRGPTLEDATNDLELEEIVALIAQVAETLEDAHRHGLIHRDIKPGNVILEPLPGGGWKPIICDFGLALHVDASVLTLPNALTGTPAYMAPEQVRGDRRHIGPATDVYALGGTLYFLLVGRPPCVSTVTQEMLKVKRERRFPTPRALEPSIPEALEAILLRCLAPAPAERYPTMEALAADLWGFLGRAPRRAARKWRGLAATAAALGLVAGLGGLAWHRVAAQERSAERFNRAAQEASNLMAGLRYEQEQPLHDTRSALARIRAARDTATAPADDPAWALVRGTADYCLDNLPAARAELEKAFSRGPALPETAYLLGIVCARQWLDLEHEPAQRGQAAGADLRAQAQAWFQKAKGLSRDREEFAQALLALMGRDLPGALAHCRAAEQANPWLREAGALGSHCLARLARTYLAGGDDASAGSAYREALRWAEDGARQAQSDAGLRHAALVAAMGLAELDRARDQLTRETVQALVARAEQNLLINPDGGTAQADWISVQCLVARHQADAGLDPKPTLDRALAFYWTRTQDPRPPALHAAQRMLNGLTTERDRPRTRPTLPRTIKASGHVPDGLSDMIRSHTKPRDVPAA